MLKLPEPRLIHALLYWLHYENKKPCGGGILDLLESLGIEDSKKRAGEGILVRAAGNCRQSFFGLLDYIKSGKILLAKPIK